MTDPITREERAALIERAQTFLDADEYNRLSHSNACEILRALTASEAEVERLREALEPFVWAYNIDIGDDAPDEDLPPPLSLTVGDFRRARAALTGETGEKK